AGPGAAGALLLDVLRAGVGDRDQRLARHAVGQDAGSAQAVPVDDGHLGPELGGDQGRLVASRTAAEDDHPLTTRAHVTIQPAGPAPSDNYAAGMALYAAYAVSLDPRRMAERAPHSPLQGTGWITGWRLTFGGEELGWDGALATLVEDPAEQVYV